MEAASAHLLNFSQPFDCTLLDQIVLIAMDSNHPQRAAANEFLVRMKDHPDMWRRADAILEVSKQPATKFFGLQVLTEAINTHWKVIPAEQREGIRNYIVTKIIELSSTDEAMKQNHSFLSRLNMVLVQILKQDWPQNWPSFIPDLVGSSRTSESLCENNMKLLQLLSEDIFDFSQDTMTAMKIKSLKDSLMSDFAQIYHLCEFILGASQKPSLIISTLNTLQRFLTWIPFGYIFETHLITGLINTFLPKPQFRTATIDCLIEVASLPPADIPENYKAQVQNLLVEFIRVLRTTLPQPQSIPMYYDQGNDEEQLFFARLGLFLGTYLKSYLSYFDLPENRVAHQETVTDALWYMLAISKIDDDEVFKACLELWIHFSKELYTADITAKTSGSNLSNANAFMSFGMHSLQQDTSKHGIFESILQDLRIVMIDKMAKPEEVIIVEDDNGEIVREQTKDTEVIAQYKTMKETLVYLTHLNSEYTEQIMLEKLDLQVAGGKFTWNGLNTLCWAIGSISGAMGEVDEKRFLVSVIKDLLRLCEEQRGKDNKAVVASNIMYIVGQYPRFLRAHWKFLKTVVNKLFEFMHELHPGVQDMACDTFLKISQKCKRKFMTQQVDENEPYILALIHNLGDHVKDLQAHQVQSFYESMGTMLSDQGPAITLQRDQVMIGLMELQNQTWKTRMAEGGQNVQRLLEVEVCRELSKIVKINTKVCSSAGAIYLHQLSFIFQDMLGIYRLYGQQVSAAVEQHGTVAVRWTNFKAMRHVKTDILELLTACIEVSTEGGEASAEIFKTTFMPSIMNDILTDYRSSPPSGRDAKVLTMFATALSTLKGLMSSEVPLIMETIFEKTLEMITTNMLDYPEHRISFFNFLRYANQHCFYALFSIPSHHQKLVIDSVVWAFKHTERNISETGLEILLELLQNVSANQQFAQSFYAAFMLPLIQDVFGVLTDRLHKSGFVLQASILKHLFHATQLGQVTAPLHSMANMDNVQFLKDHISGLLIGAFPNLTKTQVAVFVRGLFDVTMDLNAFKQHLRDFLITIKEFANEDNSDLYLEEEAARQELRKQQELQYLASVPGLIKPSELGDDSD